MVIDTIDGETPQDEKQLEALWAQISGQDPVAANAALWKVIAAGPKALASIEKRWGEFGAGGRKQADPARDALREQIEKILAGLTHEKFINRQLAQKQLMKLGEDSLDLIVEQFEKSKDPELRRALTTVITKMRKGKVAQSAHDHKEIVGSRVAHLRRIVETCANGYQITSSEVKKPELGYDCIGAPADGLVPIRSGSGCVPRYTWFPNRGTSEWLQYEFAKPKTISMAEVYWYAKKSGSKTTVPESWQVLYKTEAGEWEPVDHKGDYQLELDQMNQVKFKPVRTSAVRLSVQQKEGRSAGVLEFRVSDEPKK